MALKKYKPVTPGQRQLVLVDRKGLHKGGPLKKLTEGQKSYGGRNSGGRITVRWRGGGHKQSYRIIDFKRAKNDVPAIVERIEYDPNRTSFIALLKYKDGKQAYIIAPQRLAAGDTVMSGDRVDVKPGNAMPLGAMPVGTIVHNIEMKPAHQPQLAFTLTPPLQSLPLSLTRSHVSGDEARQPSVPPVHWGLPIAIPGQRTCTQPDPSLPC